MDGEGTLVVGDTVNYYEKGTILVIGSNLPHVFKSDTKIATASHMLSLFFTKELFEEGMLKLDVLTELPVFFKRALHGFKITSSKKEVIALFLGLKKASKLNRFIILLQVLEIAVKADYKSLSSFVYEKEYSDNEGKRMRDVFEYTMLHFNNAISLDTISEVANMTKNAFCKYFKKRTNKTYVQFLNELRIEHACKLMLSRKELSVVEIAELSGFQNISNFNRQFKAVKAVSPSRYRKEN